MITDNPAIQHRALSELLHAEWEHRSTELIFLPVGGASWSYRSGDWFVNVRDGIDDGRDVSLSFEMAGTLRDRCGLDFLLTPTRTVSGHASAKLDGFVVVVMPFVDGVVRGWDPFARHELAEAVEWVSRIHEATPDVADVPLSIRPFEDWFAEPLRDALDRTCEDPVSSPFGTRLRDLVAPYRDALLDSLAEHEALVHGLTQRDHAFVVTHGEPDPQNVLEAADGTRWLIDLGEIALAPRELDLYVLRKAARPEDGQLVGDLDPDLARYYENRWHLSEITAYLDHLSRSDGADVPEGDRWDWRHEPEPEWRTEGERAWGLLRYFLSRHLD